MTRGFAPLGGALDPEDEPVAPAVSSVVWVRSVDVIAVATG
jgi:hypothetical protein